MSDRQDVLKVLVTGAYGLIGNLIYAHLAAQPDRYVVYGSSRRPHPSLRASGMTYHDIPKDKLRLAELTDIGAVQHALEGVDIVVHMAADASGSAGWESVLHNNIIGVHNLFEACRLTGVRRVLYASTNQVVFGYRDTEPYKSLFEARFDTLDPATIRPIENVQPARPLNDYACSKVYGEALAHYYAHVHGLSCIVLRVGWVTADNRLPRPAARALWCSQRDCVQLVERAINAPADLHYDVFFVQSANTYNLVDIQHARAVLGYAPEDGV